MTVQEVQVRRGRIDEARVVDREQRALEEGEIRIAVRDFALTANNVSYAASGEVIGYWRFFPASSEGEDWGVTPVWGFAEILDTRHPEYAAGETFWGFLPMAEEAVFAPAGRKPHGFIDAAEHRRALPAVYNQYLLTANDPGPLKALADQRSLLLPLFFTSYVLADYILDNACFGARQAVLSSASSKTAFGLAALLADAPGKPLDVIGLTSPGNADFTRGLGYYDRVFTYDDISELDAASPAIFVDMAGSAQTLERVHRHFAEALKASIRVGLTHWDAAGPTAGLPGPKPAFFFAPTQVAKRDEEWGPGEVQKRAQAAFIQLAQDAGGHLEFERRAGAAEIARTFTRLARGEIPPQAGLILNFQD